MKRNSSCKSQENPIVLVAAIKDCVRKKDLKKGRKLHIDAIRTGVLEDNVYVGSSLVHMYAKCGSLEKAHALFDCLRVHDVVSWNALISGYAQQGQGEHALNCFEQMQYEGITPSATTFVCVLNACASARAIEKGKEINSLILKERLIYTNVLVANALVDMYVKFDDLTKAQEVFNSLTHRNVVSWNTLISGYTQHGHSEMAIDCFEQMQSEGISPDVVTFACILKACGSIGAVDQGKEVHDELVKYDMFERNVLVGNTLLDMYMKCDLLLEAQQVFDTLQVRDKVTWTCLISGYAKHGRMEETMQCIDRVRCSKGCLDPVMLSCILNACGRLQSIDKGREIHVEIVRGSLLRNSGLIGNALVDMYAKCSLLSDAQEVFDELQIQDVISSNALILGYSNCGALEKAEEVFNKTPIRNTVSWNTLMAGYVEQGLHDDVIDCYERMQSEEILPDVVTFSYFLSACGSIGAIDKGKEVHKEIVRQCLVETDDMVGNTLVDMYAKCGSVEKAHEVFDELQVRNTVSWNALITGYAQVGRDDMVFVLLDKMTQNSVRPNVITFNSILTACSHSGLIGESQMCFEMMTRVYDIIPTLEHYTCLVDLFGRAGQLDKAVAIIWEMPTADYLPVWSALLGACQKWGNLELALWAFGQAVNVDDKEDAVYVSMSNVYAIASFDNETMMG